MILVKAGRVDLLLVGGDSLVMPADYGLIHDETGEQLPYCSLFIGPFEDGGDFNEDVPEHARKYFGDGYKPRIAHVDVPASGWDPLGRVREIEYFRPGKLQGDWWHPFEVFPEILQSGDWYRIDLPPDCEVNWRGIVWP